MKNNCSLVEGPEEGDFGKTFGMGRALSVKISQTCTNSMKKRGCY